MTTKWLYIIVGFLVGIIIMLVLTKLSSPVVMAQDSGRASGYIAITTNTQSGNTILWVLDTRRKNLLVYEYTSETHLTLKTLRDIQWDMDIPDGVAFPARGRGMTPSQVKEKYKEIKEAMERKKR